MGSDAHATASLDSPPCDRCGGGTGKPWLWRKTRTPWLCAPCEEKIADEMVDMYRTMKEQQDYLFQLRVDLASRRNPSA
ncbi:hypothetical protein [Streptomyces lasiicapitis]|uniref:hypothetical protein n=1 Tax=Streptomyces lasiicapitis TaxID=1923961 RepID=UPI00366715D2